MPSSASLPPRCPHSLSEVQYRFVPYRLRQAIRSRLVRMTRDALVDRFDELDATEHVLHAEVATLRDELEGITGDLGRRLDAVRWIVASSFDRIAELRAQLIALRESEAYRHTIEELEPLVTVRIATHNRARILCERTIPSVLAQTYERLELIVVGDCCTDDTADRVRSLSDPRVRFIEMTHRAPYPAEPDLRWLVAGVPAMNLGAWLAGGRWIAPLDDDDEFTPDHIEVLLQAALAGANEMVYGRYHVVRAPRQKAFEIEDRYPPERGFFGFQAALYMTVLRFFEYEPQAWMLGEPADWNLCRRMLEAGVSIGHANRHVTTIYPAGPRHTTP